MSRLSRTFIQYELKLVYFVYWTLETDNISKKSRSCNACETRNMMSRVDHMLKIWNFNRIWLKIVYTFYFKHWSRDLAMHLELEIRYCIQSTSRVDHMSRMSRTFAQYELNLVSFVYWTSETDNISKKSRSCNAFETRNSILYIIHFEDWSHVEIV